MAQVLEKHHPKRVTSTMAKALRPGKVFIDWSQNSRHKTTVAVYSLRARPRPTVSTPVTWDEVEAAAERRRPVASRPPTCSPASSEHGDLFAATLDGEAEAPEAQGLRRGGRFPRSAGSPHLLVTVGAWRTADAGPGREGTRPQRARTSPGSGLVNPDGVRAVYRAFGRLVYAVAHRTLGSRELAEEATQQTFVKAWQAAPSFDPSASSAVARDDRPAHGDRPAPARGPASDRRAAPMPSLNDPAVVELPPGRRHGPTTCGRCARPSTPCPTTSATIVRLQHLEELTQAEVAERLGIPIGTVKSRSYRAHRTLAATPRAPAGRGRMIRRTPLPPGVVPIDEPDR